MIELRGVYAGYGKTPVLQDASLCLQPGQLTVIVGPNGSGKSTLLKTIAGVMKPSKGEILLDGASVAELSRREVAKRAAYLPQGREVPDMTVEQLVLHGRFPYLNYPSRYTPADRQKAQAAMERIEIAEFCGQPLAVLSGGMRQKAYIAMALTQDAPYILLDEPTTYLDVAHQLLMMKILRQLADEGRGIVAVMHDLPLAFTCADHVVLLQQGRIAAVDTPQTVCESGRVQQLMGVELAYCPQEKEFRYRYRDQLNI